MADTLTVSKFDLAAHFKFFNDDASAPVSTALVQATASGSFADGTAADQADKVYYSKGRSLAASASEELDLAGSLVDPLGQTITFVEIVGIYIKVTSTNNAGVVVGGSSSNGFANWISSAGTFATDQPKVHVIGGPSGGFFGMRCSHGTGWAVAAGTGDKLKIANDSGSLGVTYDVLLVGRSA